MPTRSKLTSEQLRSHDVYIGRGCEKLGLFRSEWCNPFKISRTQTRAAVLQLFAVYARAHLAHKVHLLAGRRLLCHCETHQNCHGDVLIELFKDTCCPLSQSKSPPCDGDVPLSSSVDGIVQEMGSEIVRKFSRSPSQPWWQFVNRRQADAGMGVLILFAGLRRPNSIKNWLIRLSAHYKVAVNIEDFDILNGPEHDLVDDLVARKVLHMIDEQAFQAIFMSPPCSTFTCLRSRSLRGVTGKDRYGWQHLTKDELEAVKCETACSSFTARCAQRASELGVPWLVELPAEHPGKSHMLQLDEWSLPLSASIDRVYLDQCHFGSIDKKPTILVGTLPVARLSGRLLKNTDSINVLKGTEALPPGGYPAELCKQLAHKILLAAVNRSAQICCVLHVPSLVSILPGQALRICRVSECRLTIRVKCFLHLVYAKLKISSAWAACVRAGGFVSACPYLVHEVC